MSSDETKEISEARPVWRDATVRKSLGEVIFCSAGTAALANAELQASHKETAAIILI
jgi:hypothetical protein